MRARVGASCTEWLRWLIPDLFAILALVSAAPGAGAADRHVDLSACSATEIAAPARPAAPSAGYRHVDLSANAATNVEIGTPAKVAVDREGNLLVVGRHAPHVLRIDARSGAVATLPSKQAGPGIYGRSLLVEPSGNLLVASGHQVIRVDPAAGPVAEVAGTGEQGFSGDGCPARSARLSSPTGLAVAQEPNWWCKHFFARRFQAVPSSERAMGA